METLINSTKENLERLVVDKELIPNVITTCIQDVHKYVIDVISNPQLYREREKVLTDILSKVYSMIPNVKDELWVRINLIGFLYQFFYGHIEEVEYQNMLDKLKK